MDDTDGKWTVKQAKDKFKYLLKEYRRQMRLRNNHTGGGEEPEVLWATEMSLMVSSSDPAINPSRMIDGSQVVDSPELISDNSLKRRRQATAKQTLQTTMNGYMDMKVKRMKKQNKSESKMSK